MCQSARAQHSLARESMAQAQPRNCQRRSPPQTDLAQLEGLIVIIYWKSDGKEKAASEGPIIIILNIYITKVMEKKSLPPFQTSQTFPINPSIMGQNPNHLPLSSLPRISLSILLFQGIPSNLLLPLPLPLPVRSRSSFLFVCPFCALDLVCISRCSNDNKKKKVRKKRKRQHKVRWAARQSARPSGAVSWAVLGPFQTIHAFDIQDMVGT